MIAIAASSLSAKAHADEPVSASEPRQMRETAEITSVVDAFDTDNDDPFDLNLTLGFEQRWKHANIRRESDLAQPGLSTGGFTPATENVASFSESTSILNIGADIGIFRDLALILRLPLILNDSAELGDLNGSSNNPSRTQDSNGQQLFSVPFKGPSHSGVDWFSAGLDYAIFNQQRDWTKPTWVVGIEGRFGIGTPLHACNANPQAGTAQCPDPANPSQNRDPGISRGMTTLAAHTVFSRRFGYVEPYSGLWFLADFPHDSTDYGATDNLKGSLGNHPPLVGTFSLGTEIIPYERRDAYQRLLFDVRASGAYHSEGREYSELFDALGSSTASSLRNFNPGGYMASTGSGGQTTSVADPAAQKVYFTGITDQQAYGSLGLQASATYQVGEYVKFNAGGGLMWNQNHLISAADSCNPDFKGDPGAAGPCHGVVNNGIGPQPVSGIPNPNYRAVIDSPGRRFSVDDTTVISLWVAGVVMF
ncbi:MAG: hypothetical protein ABI183_14765 [Polyangiaceae bacterium]